MPDESEDISDVPLPVCAEPSEFELKAAERELTEEGFGFLSDSSKLLRLAVRERAQRKAFQITLAREIERRKDAYDEGYVIGRTGGEHETLLMIEKGDEAAFVEAEQKLAKSEARRSNLHSALQAIVDVGSSYAGSIVETAKQAIAADAEETALTLPFHEVVRKGQGNQGSVTVSDVRGRDVELTIDPNPLDRAAAIEMEPEVAIRVAQALLSVAERCRARTS
jgi:hypothetical protein